MLFALPSAVGHRHATCLPPFTPAASANILCRASVGPTKSEAGKWEVEPDGATKTWLRLPFGSREGLQHQLHTQS
jgi:hypothetical protein